MSELLKPEDMKTTHRLIQGDSRQMPFIKDESVHLVVTSPPYWTLKKYEDNVNQLGHVADYEAFLSELSKVWKEVHRVLDPRRTAGVRRRRCLPVP